LLDREVDDPRARFPAALAMISKPDTPERFGRFVVEDAIGRGGMGVVYKAQDPLIGRPVAIKVLRMDAAMGSESLTNLQSRFEQEFRSAGALSHPNIVTIYDVGQEGELSYIAMEFVEGWSLEKMLRSTDSIPLSQVLGILVELCDGLDYAHKAGVVHRDIKPANVLFTPEGRPKITDFGVAKVKSSNLTMTGTLVGTPGYMSPEQILGKKVTGASDQFSIAVMAYQMLCGRLPFQSEEAATILYHIVHEQPPAPHEVNPTLPPEIDAALLKGLAKSADDRYPNCATFARALCQSCASVPGMEQLSVQLSGQISTTMTPTSGVPPSGLRAPLPRSGADQPTAAMPDARLDRSASRSGTGSHAIHEHELRREAPVSYDTAGSWWQRQRPAGRLGLIAAGLALIGALGWFGYQATQAPVVEDDRTATTEPEAGTGTENGTAAGPDVEEEIAPSSELVFTVASEPPGAAITVDGRDEGVTPVDLQLRVGERYDIRLALAGYRTRTIEDFEPTAEGERVLSYPLERLPPPGTLAVQGSFEFALEVDGRRVTGQPSLSPGTHQVRILAPSVYYSDTRQVEVKSGETTTVRLPPTVSVRIAAVPANAKVVVDDQAGRATEVPFDLVVVQGSQHRLRFEWPNGDTRERQIQFDSRVGRVIGTVSDIEVR
jgi:serine/threonine protein kinase